MMMSLRASFVAFATLILVNISGCGDDDKGTNSNSIPPELVGTWTFQSATVDGVPFDLKYVLVWEPNTVLARITVNGDGFVAYEELDTAGTVVRRETGTIEVNDDSFTVTSEIPIPQTGTWAVSENQLTITTSVAGHPVVVIAIKEPAGSQ
ncbi:MAG: lipocalin family protein [Candidatus Zixiibacteriota bacterium]